MGSRRSPPDMTTQPPRICSVLIALLVVAVLGVCQKDTKQDAVTLDALAAAAAATALAETVDAFGARMAALVPPREYVDNVQALTYARQVAAEPAHVARMRHVARLYGDFARAARAAVGSRRAALQIVESILLAAPAIAPAPASDRNARNPAPNQLDHLAEIFEKELESFDVKTAYDLSTSVYDAVATVASVGLWMQEDGEGRHVARERLEFQVAGHAPPADLVGETGDLELPVPLDTRSRDSLAGWLKPVGANWLFEVAHGWAGEKNGMADRILDAVIPVLIEE